MELLARSQHQARVEDLLRQFPVVAILGPRQVGKTTLARQIAAHEQVHTWFDLEDPADLARLADPGLALRSLRGLVVIDEIQLMPELFGLLRVLADRMDGGARFLILGSSSPDVSREGAETLAGRLATYRLGGFDLRDVGAAALDELWLRGGFPRSFLADSLAHSAEWRRQFVDTFLQRDLPRQGLTIPPATLRRFWAMLAHYHGQTWNASEFARSFGVSDVTVRRYLDILTHTYVVVQLQPWHENIRKRQVKAPKIYFGDSGLVHTLLGLERREEIERHPKLGASWEGFALTQVVARLGARPDECFFWATHAGAELDLLVVRGDTRRGFEFKRSEQPRTTKSMHSAWRDLSLQSLDIVHAGNVTFPLTEDFRALSLRRVLDDLDPLSS